MRFDIYTDSSANLTPDIAEEWNIHIVSLSIRFEDGTEFPCYGGSPDLHRFYDELRRHSPVQTSMINASEFEESFRASLENDLDILYISMSSGISGTADAARIAAAELNARYPERRIIIIDTLAASLGEGLFAVEAARLRKAGKTLDECAEWCNANIHYMNQFLAVDDLSCLRRGGRISGIAALAGALLHLKPVLFGNSQGKFSLANNSIGRKKSLKYLSDICIKRLTEPEQHVIGIAHADCLDAVSTVTETIKRVYPNQQFLVRCYEPGTGAHTGADAIAIFFFGLTRDSFHSSI